MNSHTFNPRPTSSADQIPSQRKSHPSRPRPQSNLSDQRQSRPGSHLSSSGYKRPQSTGINSIRSDGSWKAPEVLAWKRPQRATRVTRYPTTPERQVNHDMKPAGNAAHGAPVPQDQKRPARRKDSNCSVGTTETGSGTRTLSKHRDATSSYEPHQGANTKAAQRPAFPVLRDISHHSTLSAFDANQNVPTQQYQGQTRRDKLSTLSKDFQNQVVNPGSKRCIQPSEEGISSSLASKKVVHWLKTSQNRTERPRTSSLTQALRFTALLAQVPLADAGLDEKIIPSRYNPENRTTQGSRFTGC